MHIDIAAQFRCPFHSGYCKHNACMAWEREWRPNSGEYRMDHGYCKLIPAERIGANTNYGE